MKSWDAIISGAGIIGVSLALELRERGAQVLVLDSGDPGREASSAAAGMLAAADPETPSALRPLATASAKMFPAYVQKLEAAAQMQVDFRRLGAIALLQEASAPSEYRHLSASGLQQLEPSLNQQGLSAFLVEEDSVDPQLLMLAALSAAQNLGIEIRGHSAVKAIRARDGKVEVSTACRRVHCAFCHQLPGRMGRSASKTAQGPDALRPAAGQRFTARIAHAGDLYCPSQHRQTFWLAQPWKTLVLINQYRHRPFTICLALRQNMFRNLRPRQSLKAGLDCVPERLTIYQSLALPTFQARLLPVAIFATESFLRPLPLELWWN